MARFSPLLLLLALQGCTAEPKVRELEEQWQPVAREGVEGHLRVLSFNTWSIPFRADHEELRDRSAEAIGELDCDLVALQEVWREQDAEAFGRVLRRRGLRYQVWRASSRPMARESAGLLLASRYPIEDESFRPFMAGDLPWWPWPPDWYATKGLLEATVVMPSGPIRVVETHLHAAYGNGGHAGDRLGQMLELVNTVGWAGRKPTLILGDVNTRPGELPYRALTELLPVRLVGRSRVDVILAGDGGGRGLRPANVEVAMTQDVTLRSGRVSPLSDHAGLLADLQIVRSEASGEHAGEHNELRADIVHELDRSASRARWHTATGRALSVAFLLGALMLFRRGRRRWSMLILLCLMSSVWAGYHGWLLGPEQRHITSELRASVAPPDYSQER